MFLRIRVLFGAFEHVGFLLTPLTIYYTIINIVSEIYFWLVTTQHFSMNIVIHDNKQYRVLYLLALTAGDWTLISLNFFDSYMFICGMCADNDKVIYQPLTCNLIIWHVINQILIYIYSFSNVFFLILKLTKRNEENGTAEYRILIFDVWLSISNDSILFSCKELYV